MVFKIIIVLGAIAGIWNTPKRSPLLVKLILGLLIVAIAITFLPMEWLAHFGFDLFAIGLLAIVGYAALRSNLQFRDRILLAVSATLCFVSFSFHIYHLPGAYWLSLLMVAPLSLYVYALVRRRAALRDELGLLTICAAEASVQLWMIIRPLLLS